MIKLLPEETRQIHKFKARIMEFNEYSFERYSELKIINAYLAAFISRLKSSEKQQVFTEMLFELDNENESLQVLRYADDKSAALKDSAAITLRIIDQLETYKFPFNGEK